ncbi:MULTISPECIES: NtaA/DmoA family FMN-dependent monooxygenase [unclassified Pseudoclavibacter]|uniref:NtaA/DmoA family FMN-dependent monooxygenase n=1 Tax=unclassified Pseudoclavibacter TaxID=2615177 RepID=UPI00130118C3|nr:MULTISPECIES: NtaA/DmoA family FMN-dependent monooxygenase [unclassified Pseudoclavibacter]KAB1644477.1 NtaA/DmoA family FMN-dependent monooxygenase [Pseudoclavibacter sp. CFCC 14310]KAB1664019.1 NtaA/DmoA family FMN-dependent monooxygenase [Pseudoclavibacter sp. CFCC 13611]
MSTPSDSTPRKQIILAAHVGGVNEHTLWEAPGAGSQIEFETFEHVAQTAERGFFDYFFLAEGLALRQHGDALFDHDIVGRPDTIPVLAALAAVTEHIGLIGTLNSTFNEPYELARQFASLDQVSNGRAGWNVVTSFDAFTGANFRRGGYLPREQRYERAEEFLQTVRQLWDSWPEDAIVADKETGRFLASAEAGAFAHHGEQFDVEGRFTVPRSPQGRPVIVQAGVSNDGRDFAAANADVIFSPFHEAGEAKRFYADIQQRLVKFGRHPGDLKIVPSVGFVLGETEAEAQERAREVRHQVYTPKTVQVLAEQIWNRDLSNYDPDGPLPDLDPALDAPRFVNGRTYHWDRTAKIAELRAYADAHGTTLRETFEQLHGRLDYVGTPEQIADALDDFVQQGAADGFVIAPPVIPSGFDEFVDKVVPLLQERGSLRTEYAGTTLRSNLGIPVPERGEQAPAVYA